MGNSVDIYMKTGSGIGRLTSELARTSRATTCQIGADTSFFRADLQSTIDLPGFMEITIGFTDLKETGEAGTFEETALAHHEYEISIEFMATQEKATPEGKNELGLRVFELFSALGYPMTYVNLSEKIAADYIPRKGIRYFSPPVEIEDESLVALSEKLGKEDPILLRGGPEDSAGTCSAFITERLIAVCADSFGIPSAPLIILDERLSDTTTIGEVVSSSLSPSPSLPRTQKSLSTKDITDTLRDFTRSPENAPITPVKLIRFTTSNGEMTISSEASVPHRREQDGHANTPIPGENTIHRGPLPDSNTELGQLIKALRTDLDI